MILFIFLSSCSLLSREASFSPTDQNLFNQAIIYMQDSKFKEAVNIFDELLKTPKSSHLQTLIFFNKGSAYREMGDCKESLKHYNKILNLYPNPDMRTRTFLELSATYECLAEYKKSFFALKKLEEPKAKLTIGIKEILQPARLSLLYAKMNQKIQSKILHKVVLANVLSLRGRLQSESDVSELSKLFYLMGRSYTKPTEINQAFLRSFSLHQAYLLQSAFLKDRRWSPLAQKHLKELVDLAVKKPESKQAKTELRKSLKIGLYLIRREKFKELISFYKDRLKFLKP